MIKLKEVIINPNVFYYSVRSESGLVHIRNSAGDGVLEVENVSKDEYERFYKDLATA